MRSFGVADDGRSYGCTIDMITWMRMRDKRTRLGRGICRLIVRNR